MDDDIFSQQHTLLTNLSEAKRYQYGHIQWDHHLVGIVGARGVGKTTMLLQRIKDQYGDSGKAAYVSIDHPYFDARPLFEFAESFAAYGGELLCVDEVHKQADWSRQIKAIHDTIPSLRVIFSGSSILRMSAQAADLSRRALVYELHGLSFREYLLFAHKQKFEPLTLAQILVDHVALAGSVVRRIKILPCFRAYLDHGYYPFFLEGVDQYQLKLTAVMGQILEMDLPFAASIAIRQIGKLKKLLYLISTSVPMIPDIARLSRMTGISRPTIYDYLEKLQEARLLRLVRQAGKGTVSLAKPEKVYLDNTNLAVALAQQPDSGTVRETFFANQIASALSRSRLVDEELTVPARGDFLVQSKWTFEVGGKGKRDDRIIDLPGGYLAVDDIEVGQGRRIPLWLFGFLY
ncbi:AAA family ATPase [Desulfonatronospira sp.]|uniref:ATP-binding protein n=1 Tax=Desulfonatronospira sp. TaxID=1962951 RepID=UPI0025B82348|nr:AAA family ATPase [Desulfonatronospira sp.]